MKKRECWRRMEKDEEMKGFYPLFWNWIEIRFFQNDPIKVQCDVGIWVSSCHKKHEYTTLELPYNVKQRENPLFLFKLIFYRYLILFAIYKDRTLYATVKTKTLTYRYKGVLCRWAPCLSEPSHLNSNPPWWRNGHCPSFPSIKQTFPGDQSLRDCLLGVLQTQRVEEYFLGSKLICVPDKLTIDVCRHRQLLQISMRQSKEKFWQSNVWHFSLNRRRFPNISIPHHAKQNTSS